MRIRTYEYSATYCVRGLDPETWGTTITWESPHRLGGGELMDEARTQIGYRESPHTDWELLNVSVHEVTQTRFHIATYRPRSVPVHN